MYIIVQINGKHEERLGRGRKKDDCGAFVFWITVSETEILDWSATCQSVTKSSQSQRNNHWCNTGSTMVVRLTLNHRSFVGFSKAFSLDSEVESNNRRTLLGVRFSLQSWARFPSEITTSYGEQLVKNSTKLGSFFSFSLSSSLTLRNSHCNSSQ